MYIDLYYIVTIVLSMATLEDGCPWDGKRLPQNDMQAQWRSGVSTGHIHQ